MWARIVDDVAVDVLADDPVGRMHPTLAAAFEAVPGGVVQGARRVAGEWVAPDPDPETSAPAAPVQLALIDFLRLFAPAELAAFNALRKVVAALDPADYGDPAKAALVGFEVGLTHYDALRAGLIELDHPQTVQWLSLLVPLGVLTSERLAQVLVGEAPQ